MNINQVVEKIYDILLNGRGGGNERRAELCKFIALLLDVNGSKVNLETKNQIKS